MQILWIVICSFLFIIFLSIWLLKFRVNIKIKIDFENVNVEIMIFSKKVYNKTSKLNILDLFKKKDEDEGKKIITLLFDEAFKDKININAEVSTNNNIGAIYLATGASTWLSIILSKNIKRKYVHNIQYIVRANYHETYIFFNIDMIVKVWTLIKSYYIFRRKKNGRTSN